MATISSQTHPRRASARLLSIVYVLLGIVHVNPFVNTESEVALLADG